MKDVINIEEESEEALAKRLITLYGDSSDPLETRLSDLGNDPSKLAYFYPDIFTVILTFLTLKELFVLEGVSKRFAIYVKSDHVWDYFLIPQGGAFKKKWKLAAYIVFKECPQYRIIPYACIGEIKHNYIKKLHKHFQESLQKCVLELCSESKTPSEIEEFFKKTLEQLGEKFIYFIPRINLARSIEETENITNLPARAHVTKNITNPLTKAVVDYAPRALECGLIRPKYIKQLFDAISIEHGENLQKRIKECHQEDRFVCKSGKLEIREVSESLL